MSTDEIRARKTAHPVLLVYDGSALAALAIERAGELVTIREGVVLCVWQPADVGFEPVSRRPFDADAAYEVRQAAEETADFGAALARKAGFQAKGVTLEAAPTWKGIIHAAREYEASVIVLGAHRHSGFVGHLLGGVASAVVSHATCPVLVVHQES